jgi:SAM-dependent methyltransferase
VNRSVPAIFRGWHRIRYRSAIAHDHTLLGARLHLPARLLWFLDRYFPPNPSAFLSAEQQVVHEAHKAAGTMGIYLRELPSRDVRVLDYGCGWGGETLWLAGHVRSVVGVDIDESCIARARAALERSGTANCTFALASGARLPFPDDSFDAVLSTDTFEHVMDIEGAFREIGRVLKPGGAFLSRFGPLFRSPHGYHLYWACQVPYAHLLFGLAGVLQLRNARAATARYPSRWEDLGLNGRRFREFKRAALDAGLEIVRFDPVPVRGVRIAARLPWIGDLFIFGVDCHLRKKPVTAVR